MKIIDIRRGDLVKLQRNLTNEDYEKIRKFAKRVSGQAEMYEYATDFIDDMLDEDKPSRVWKCDRTKKIPTEYAYLTSNAGVYVPVQFRYLKLTYRKPSHPLTNLFQA